MKIDLTQIFNGSNNSIDIDATFDMSALEYGTYCPLKQPVTVKGSVFTKADVVYLDLVIKYIFDGICDRCAEEVSKDEIISVKRVVVEKLENEDDDDDYIVLSNRELDLDSFVTEELVLSFPSKILCSDNCKGLCPQCGANLNVNKCNCKKEVDPRMEALLQLLDDE